MIEILNILLSLDDYLLSVTSTYGTLTYLLLFAVIFFETGVVITPFLPGDSLLFAAGAVASLGGLSIYLILGILFAAAVLGDTANYWIGRTWGLGIVRWAQHHRFLIKPSHIQKTQDFYNKYGASAIVLARFVPIVRTFAPFVAGVASMNYSRFLAYNVIGGAIWVILFTLGGFFFGNVPVVKENFSLVIIAIIIISFVPILAGYLKHRKN